MVSPEIPHSIAPEPVSSPEINKTGKVVVIPWTMKEDRPSLVYFRDSDHYNYSPYFEASVKDSTASTEMSEWRPYYLPRWENTGDPMEIGRVWVRSSLRRVLDPKEATGAIKGVECEGSVPLSTWDGTYSDRNGHMSYVDLPSPTVFVEIDATVLDEKDPLATFSSPFDLLQERSEEELVGTYERVEQAFKEFAVQKLKSNQ